MTSLEETLNIANGHRLSGNASLAESITHKILEAYPNDANCFQLLAIISYGRGDFNLAAEFYEKIIANGYVSAEVYSNLAASLLREGRNDEAIPALNMALSIDPNFSNAHSNLGQLYLVTGKIDDAITCYEAVLKLDPGNIKVAYTLRVLKDKRTGSPPDEFIALINNDNAERFERSMEMMNSRIPQIVRAAADEVIMNDVSGIEFPVSNALDLGCGTGRSGVEFRNICNMLDGVDLSSGMMKKAREKEVYDELFLDSFIHLMAQKKDAYDLVLAIDSLLYTGPLEEIFDSVDRVLRKPGAFAFTVEALDSGDFTVQQSSRHAHGEGYVRNLAAKHGLSVLLCQPIDRMRGNIKGNLFWLEKSE